MLAQLLEVVLLERAPLAEEHSVRGGLGMRLVFERREFERADVIRKLEKAVVGWGDEPVDNDVFPKHITNRFVHGFRNNGLAVVVVDLYLVESLKVGEVVEKGRDEIPLYANEQLVRILRIELLLVREGYVLERNALGEHCKAAEMALSDPNRKPLELFVAIKQRAEVHGSVVKPFVTNKLAVSIKSTTQVVALLVKHEGHEVVPGIAGVA